MSLLTDVQTAAAQFIAKVADLVTQTGYLIDVITGPPSGSDSLVNVGPRTLKTLSRTLLEITGAGSFNPIGVWSSGTTYAQLDGVSYNGTAYVSLQDSNLNHQPDASPTWWMQLIELAPDPRVVETRSVAVGSGFSPDINAVLTQGYAEIGDGGGALYKRVNSEPSHPGKFQSSDGAWWELQINQRISPVMLGVTFDGVTDDADAFGDLASFINYHGGGDIVFPYGKTAIVFATSPVPSQSVVMRWQGTINHLSIDYNGSKIECPATSFEDTAYLHYFGNNGTVATNLRFISPWFEQTGVPGPDSTQGMYHCWLRNGDGCHVSNLRQYSGLTGFTAQRTSSSDRFANITMENAYFENTFYPLPFAKNGDNFFGRGIKIKNPGRSYFAYNCASHDVDLEIEDHGVIDPTIDLTCYGNSAETSKLNTLEDIKVRARFVNNGQTMPAGCQPFGLQVIMQNAGAGVTIRNLDIQLDIDQPTLSSYSFGAVVTKLGDAVVRGHVVENVRISGSLKGNGQPLQFLEWFTDDWTGETVRNIVIGPLVLRGATPTNEIQIGAGGMIGLVLEDVIADGNVAITGLSAGVLQTRGRIKTGNYDSYTNAINDAAAAAANVPLGGDYRNGSIKMVRVA